MALGCLVGGLLMKKVEKNRHGFTVMGLQGKHHYYNSVIGIYVLMEGTFEPLCIMVYAGSMYDSIRAEMSAFGVEMGAEMDRFRCPNGGWNGWVWVLKCVRLSGYFPYRDPFAKDKFFNVFSSQQIHVLVVRTFGKLRVTEAN
ncbi:hypothetical protein Tco_1180521 [Tanacetum coccineum]